MGAGYEDAVEWVFDENIQWMKRAFHSNLLMWNTPTFYFIQSAFEKNNLRILQFFESKVGLNYRVVEENFKYYCLKRVLLNGNLEMLKWLLAQQFNLDISSVVCGEGICRHPDSDSSDSGLDFDFDFDFDLEMEKYSPSFDGSYIPRDSSSHFSLMLIPAIFGHIPMLKWILKEKTGDKSKQECLLFEAACSPVTAYSNVIDWLAQQSQLFAAQHEKCKNLKKSKSNLLKLEVKIKKLGQQLNTLTQDTSEQEHNDVLENMQNTFK